MKLTIWAEMSGKGARASMTVEVPDEEVRTPDGGIDEEKAEAVARDYLGNLVEWGWTVS